MIVAEDGTKYTFTPELYTAINTAVPTCRATRLQDLGATTAMHASTYVHLLILSLSSCYRATPGFSYDNISASGARLAAGDV